MQYKEIDCKVKEIYCTLKPIENEVADESSLKFWGVLNNIAIQNYTLVHSRMA